MTIVRRSRRFLEIAERCQKRVRDRNGYLFEREGWGRSGKCDNFARLLTLPIGIDQDWAFDIILILSLNKLAGFMSTQPKSIPIQRLEKGAKGKVTALIGEPDEVARLAALGIRCGVEVCSVQKGSPCIVEYGCSRMCLRTAGNLKVMVSRV